MGKKATFLRHTLVYGLGTVLLQASGIILLPLYTRYIHPADFGILEIVERAGNFLAIAFLANGISTAAFSFYCQADDSQRRAEVSATVTLTTLLAIVLGILFCWAASKPLGLFLTVSDWRLVVLGMSASLFQLLPMVQLSLMQARTQSVQYVITSLLMMITRVSLMVVAVAVFHWGIWGVMLGTITTNVLAGVILAIREFRTIGFHPSFKSLVDVLRFAWPFAPSGLLGFVLFNADRFFLLRNVGAAELGVYSLATKIASIVGIISFAPLFKVWSAELYRYYARPNGSQFVGQMFTSLLIPFAFVGLGVSLFHAEIVRILGSQPYYAAGDLVPLMIIANLFLSAQYLLDGTFYYKRQTGRKLVVTIITTACSLVLFSIFVSLWQTIGAVLAMIASMFILATTTFLFARRIFLVQYEWLRLSVLLGSAIVFAIPSYIVPLSLWGVFAKAAILLAWPICLWATGFFSPREISMMKDAFRSAAHWVRHYAPTTSG